MFRIKSAGSTVYGLRAAIAACAHPGEIEVSTDHGHFIHGFVVDGACDADIVIIPHDMLEDLDRRGLLTGIRRRIGHTGIGYCVPAGMKARVIDDAQALRAAVLAAPALYLTTAPTGEHMLTCLADMGLRPQIDSKLKLFDRATEMLAALAKEKSAVVAFGPTTELLAWREKGIAYGGGVPQEFDVPLAYDAAVLARSAQQDEAGELLDYLAGPAGLRHFRDSGVE